MNRYKIINSKQLPVHERKRLPVTFCGVQKNKLYRDKEAMSSAFCLAWLYLPDGPKLFSGSHSMIKEHTRSLPLCHGMVLTYNKVRDMRLVTKGWDVFGRGHKDYFIVSNDVTKQKGERRTHRLCHRAGGVIREFRQLPNQHLSCFKAINEAMRLRVDKNDKKFASEFLEALNRW